MTEIDQTVPAPLPKRNAELFIALLWVIAVVAATVQQGVQHQNNNFLIFRAASLHLLHGQDMYAAYPALHFDKFKYSPTFALLFLPFALPSFAVATLLWNALNAGILWMALGMVLPRRGALVARTIVFMDMLGSLQNVQSNALVAGLIILTFAAYERRHTVIGTLAAGVGASIKVFPLAALSFAIFHPRKIRVAAATALTTAGLLALPLLVTPLQTLLAQYASWRAVEAHDALDRGFTVMQMVELLFHQGWPNWPQQLAGVLLLVAPVLVRHDRWTEWSFRRLYLCSVLLFCVIFNHQSESPTFVIAAAGAAIWFASLTRPRRWEWALFAFFVVCTILASSDAMPRVLQREVFDRYRFKTVPAIVLWAVLQVKLWRTKDRAASTEPTASAEPERKQGARASS
jgi:hypothetical protein